MTNDCKTCPVSTGTHKPAEAVHQIDEPQADALRLAAWLLHRGMSGIKQNDIEASNQLRWLHAESLQHKQELAAYRFTVENREARIAELESQLEAIGAGGVEPLRKQAAAPQAVQDAVPDGWKRVPLKPTPEMCHVGRYGGDKDAPAYGEKPVEGVTAWPFVADHTAEQIYQSMLAAAPAHPAEGVPAQCPNINEPRGCWRVACQLGGKCREPERSATQPAAQGMDALTPAARDVLAERKRQIETEGWKPERDDVYDTGEMALAAACYAAHSASCAAIKAPHTARGVFVRTRSAQDFVGEMWPWSADWWKPSGHRRNLEKAAALILAEIERIDRAALASKAKQGAQP
ncbi:hypothetical protein N5D67_00900 [Comamonas aquatica]|uniref:hypothetical protein n=1 Tax=Comamonas aquatica TaxID=225991 RepID=UPI0024482DC1|nr:hypothetical protein [Comamonas aquatica]MDH1900868.1 hypothetical protein [Comamonas aquatica]